MEESHQLLDRLISSRGRLFVVSGPSGVGKGTVISSLLGSRACPAGIGKCITATTREPRPGESHGINYLFFSDDEFEERVRQGFFLEHVTYNEHLYGTPREEVEMRIAAGRDVILEIEVRGGLAVKAAIPESVLVFLAPPSLAELERRLLTRATDDAAAVARRLAIAREEMESAPLYDYRIVNDNIVDSVRDLQSVITSERMKIGKS